MSDRDRNLASTCGSLFGTKQAIDSCTMNKNNSKASSMNIALVHAHFNYAHLETVKAEMGALGAPRIKAVYLAFCDTWAALEGCHRLRAAAALGLEPELLEVEYSDELLPEFDCTIAEFCNGIATRTILQF